MNTGTTVDAKTGLDSSQLADITAEELSGLFDVQGHGLTEAQMRQTREPLGRLHVAPRVFQPRILAEKPWEKDKHVDSLRQSVKQRRDLDPIIVFPVAGKRIVVDGHCRLEAYKLAKRHGKRGVPVRYLKGTFADALGRAAEANSKDKLPLTYREKAEAAWKLVLFSEQRRCYSLREIEGKTGVSKSTVAKMRALLESTDLPANTRGMTWWEARHIGQPEREIDESWREKLVTDVAKRLLKELGPLLGKSPDIVIDAMIEAAGKPVYELVLDHVAERYADDVRDRVEERLEHPSDF